MNQYLEAFERHKPQARQAYSTFVDYCGRIICRVPGMDTIIRLAWRIECGRTIEEAAAREYLYRWHLALGRPFEDDMRCEPWRIFDAPHLLGA